MMILPRVSRLRLLIDHRASSRSTAGSAAVTPTVPETESGCGPRGAPARPTALQLIAEDADPTPPVTRFTPPGYSAGTILVAEDDARLAEMIGRVLGDEYTIAIAHDGEAALAMIPKVAPQLLITDVDMPGLSGIELSRRFRDLTGDRLAPIIVVSAMLDRATRIAGLEAGAVDYVTKPFDPLELRARIRAQFRMRDLAIRLQRAEQLSAMGILTAGLAHELRNPANGIVNAIAPLTELLPRDVVRPDTAVGQLLEVLNSCADQIGFLSRQLLGFRKGVVDLDLRQIPVRELVHRAMTMAHAGSVEIRLDATCDGVLKCAPPLLLQVLTNLIENAVYAAGPGGWVQVRTSATDTTFTVEVSDSGAGVPGPVYPAASTACAAAWWRGSAVRTPSAVISTSLRGANSRASGVPGLSRCCSPNR